jgi:Nucleotidyltransferase domain
MDLAKPYKAVCPTLDGEVLQVLFGTTLGMTGRQVARLTGRTSHSGVLEVLNRLNEQGLVDRVELNRAFLFSINREHVAYPAVAALAGIRMSFQGGLMQQLKSWQVPAIHASLFGSAARGDGSSSSDVDVFVVRPTDIPDEDERWRNQIGELETYVTRSTGNRASVLEKSEDELAPLVALAPPILEQLRSDAIRLAGRELFSLIGAREPA